MTLCILKKLLGQTRLSQRGRAILRVIESFAKSLAVTHHLTDRTRFPKDVPVLYCIISKIKQECFKIVVYSYTTCIQCPINGNPVVISPWHFVRNY